MARTDIEALRKRIVEQADALGDDGWMGFPVPREIRADGKVRVPRGAFERWAVSRAGADHLTVPWQAISPRGLKQQGDDSYHTDWMLGAGLDVHDMRSIGGNPLWEALKDAAYEARFEVERRLLDFKCSVLLPGPVVRGRVFNPAVPFDRLPEDDEGMPPVMIVRDANPKWVDLASAVLAAGGAVVVERGGEMAHMITVLRDGGTGPIVRVPDARRLYPAGTTLLVSPGEGKVALQDDGRPPTPGPDADIASPVSDDLPRGYAGTDPATWPLREVSEAEDALIVAAGPSGIPGIRSVFDLRRNDPERQRQAEELTSYIDTRGFSFKGHRHHVIALTTHRTLEQEEGFLIVRHIDYSKNGPGGRPELNNYYGPWGLWTFDRLRAAAFQVLDMVEPRPVRTRPVPVDDGSIDDEPELGAPSP